jgi:cold shock CspA family protein
MPEGYIARLVADRGFGFIRSRSRDEDTGRYVEWFFHRSQCDVLSPFDELQEKDRVEFDEEAHDKGPRAVQVRRI